MSGGRTRRKTAPASGSSTRKTTEEYAVVRDKADGIYDNLEMTLEFGQTEKFPICDNMADYCVEEEPACHDDCERGNFPPSLRPGGRENKTEIFYIDLAVIGYTY